MQAIVALEHQYSAMIGIHPMEGVESNIPGVHMELPVSSLLEVHHFEGDKLSCIIDVPESPGKVWILNKYLADNEKTNPCNVADKEKRNQLFVSAGEARAHISYMRETFLKNIDIERDLAVLFLLCTVFSIHCDGLPTIANEWRELTKMKYGSEFEQKLCNIGYHLLPVSSNKHESDYEWTISFSSIEKELVSNWTPTQRACFKATYMLIRKCVCVPTVTRCYHIKTLMFWAIEKQPLELWSFENFHQCILGILMEYLHCLVDKNLPSFFIRSLNLLKDASNTHIHYAIEDLEEVIKKTRQSLKGKEVKQNIINATLSYSTYVLMPFELRKIQAMQVFDRYFGRCITNIAKALRFKIGIIPESERSDERAERIRSEIQRHEALLHAFSYLSYILIVFVIPTDNCLLHGHFEKINSTNMHDSLDADRIYSIYKDVLTITFNVQRMFKRKVRKPLHRLFQMMHDVLKLLQGTSNISKGFALNIGQCLKAFHSTLPPFMTMNMIQMSNSSSKSMLSETIYTDITKVKIAELKRLLPNSELQGPYRNTKSNQDQETKIYQEEPCKLKDVQLGDYNLEKEIGRGKFSIVCKGTSPNGAKVAVKRLLLSENCEKENICSMLQMTTKIAKHENVLQYHQYYFHCEQGVFYVIQDYCEPINLAFYIGLCKTHIVECVSYALDMAKGLQYLHNNGIIHGDLRPENVFLIEHYGKARCILTDYGFARFRKARKKSVTAVLKMYEPPEGTLSSASDMYTLGLLFFVMIKGKAFVSEGDWQVPPILYVGGRKIPISYLVAENKLKDEFQDEFEHDKIEDILVSLLSENPEKRPSPETVINDFNILSELLKNNPKTKVYFIIWEKKENVQAVADALLLEDAK